jgi:ABC-2 type transport system ATP-binding protein
VAGRPHAVEEAGELTGTEAAGTHDSWPAVVLRGLAKAFGNTVAVAGVDLDVPAGSFFGLVGPNGAGKTTTLKMATGLLRPDHGQVWVQGIDAWADPVAAKAVIGVLPEEMHLFERLTGTELLTYNGLLRGMDAAVVEQRAVELIRVLGLEAAGRTLVVDYSHGMRKKIALACALIHGPRVLFLDEPFEAIDPVSARVIRSVLERHTDAGGTVILSSHVMEVVERLCDYVAIMHKGVLVAAGPVGDVSAGRTLEERFVELVGAVDLGTGDLGWLGTSSA